MKIEVQGRYLWLLPVFLAAAIVAVDAYPIPAPTVDEGQAGLSYQSAKAEALGNYADGQPRCIKRIALSEMPIYRPVADDSKGFTWESCRYWQGGQTWQRGANVEAEFNSDASKASRWEVADCGLCQ